MRADLGGGRRRWAGGVCGSSFGCWRRESVKLSPRGMGGVSAQERMVTQLALRLLKSCGHECNVREVSMTVFFSPNRHGANGELDLTLIVVLPRQYNETKGASE